MAVDVLSVKFFMKDFWYRKFVLTFLAVFTPLLQGASKPNIILFISDDMGWNDVGYHGSEIHIQNIDCIAHSGLELDRLRSAFLSSNAGGINDGSLLSA